MISSEFVINFYIVISIGGFFIRSWGGGMGGEGFYPQISDHQFRTFSQTCPTKCFHFAILHFFDILFQLSYGLSRKNVVFGDFIHPSCTLIIHFQLYDLTQKNVFHTPPYSLLPTSDKIISINICISWNENSYRFARFQKSKNCLAVFKNQLLRELRY